jgi:hypothetical protein
MACLCLAEDLKMTAFDFFLCAVYPDSIPYWLANLGIGWYDGENSPRIIAKPDGQAK